MSSFQNVEKNVFPTDMLFLTTPPRRELDSQSPVPTVYQTFCDLCNGNEAIFLHLTLLMRKGSGMCSRADTKELKVTFSITDDNKLIVEKINEAFELSVAAQFKDPEPSLDVRINQLSWRFRISPDTDESNRIGLTITPMFENSIVDDITERFHLINGDNEVLVHPFFVGE